MLKKFILLLISLLLGLSLLYAEENFSEMSTQELISIMGYVKKENIEKFNQELKSRVQNMNEKEKIDYEKNLDKVK